jgi:predicted cupin superfamily sugar epimerase
VLTVEQLIAHFGLEPLPVEGGLFRQSYYSTEVIPQAALPARYAASKPFCGAIFYLLTAAPDSFSALHMLPTDEIYHFYLGDPVELLQLYPDGASAQVVLGQDILNGQHVQYVAPRDVWQGARLLPGGRFALLGTTMAPAFTSDDYRGGDREALLRQYPAQAELIRQLIRPSEAQRMPPGAGMHFPPPAGS